ncbi:glutamyl-tRNA reductase [Orenia metallireducens]|uniref:Glutamyl-tRNA reductase n=1 Tax=Orenia metallireducens TaxID=1413210 RepID=A0A1C0A7F7_9FIRM|nr:glutamyl-tRNA reductase [Orenia metallireducens]OCL26148.1 glutamyl-tRNA reductase [Orenia metallireducens]
MDLVVIGLNYKTTPLELRERFSLTHRKHGEILEEIALREGIAGAVTLSTCNRTEFYLAVNQFDIQELSNWLFSLISHFESIDLAKYLYSYQGIEMVEHLYRVVSGIDSLVIGEAQILGQVKNAFQSSQELGLVDKYLYYTFTESFRVAKRVRTETEIGRGATSVSYAAVKLAKKIFGSLEGETVLILGAGKMSELALKSLVDNGVKGVMVANRTYSRAQELAKKFSGEVIRWRQLADWINKVDIIIGSTAAPHYVLHYDLLEKVMLERRGPLFLIDIALPRDIDPKVANIPGVHLYDIDDLEGFIEYNLVKRKEELDKVESIIKEEKANIREWLKQQKIIPLIKEIRAEANAIKERELARALKRLSKEDNEVVLRDLAHRLTNKLLHQPTVKIKELGSNDISKEQITLIKEIFIEN